MIYIVSGYMRSGTSMMMRALEAGGMTASFSRERDKMLEKRWGEPDKSNTRYSPNPNGYYELKSEDYTAVGFPFEYEGKLIKCLWGLITILPVGEYRVIFMRRPTEEIRASHMAAFSETPAFVDSNNFEKKMNDTVAILRDRKSFITVDEVWMGDVIADPKKVFKSLDWPVDPELAAVIPNKKLVRYSA